MPVPLFDTRTPIAPLRGAIDAALADVIDGSRFILGPEVAAFESEFASYLGAGHAIGVANGTDAITLAVELPGTDEAARTHLAIPMSPVLDADQATEVVAAVRDAGLGRPH